MVFHVIDSGDKLQLLLNGIQAGGLCVIDFYADWCNPCKRLENELTEYINNNKKEFTNVSFFKVNIDDKELLMFTDTFYLTTIPHVVFMKRGKVCEEFVRGSNYAEVIRVIKKLS
jgi:thioredoxin-like negative regulator of GroEL